MKKAISVLLAVLMCWCCMNAAFASEESPIKEIQKVWSFGEKAEIIVLTYDAAYSALGEKPNVTLNTGTKEITVPAKDILQEVYAGEGTNYPQLFVRLPDTGDAFNHETVISVSEGAFRDGSGQPAPAASLNLPNSGTSYSVTGHSEYGIEDVFYHKTPTYYVLVGTPVTSILEGSGDDVWKDASKFYVDGKEVGEAFTPMQDGEYTVTCKLNDLVWDEYTFTALTEKQAYSQSLRSSWANMLMIPSGAVEAFAASLIPGFGLMMAFAGLFVVFFMIPYTAFASIFKTQYTGLTIN